MPKDPEEKRRPERKRKRRKSRKRMAPRKPLPNNVQTGFLVETYDGQGIKQAYMDQKGVSNLDLDAYDCCLASCLGISRFRDPKTGKWINFGTNGHGIGPKAWEILVVTQNRPGIHLDHFTLSQVTGDENFADGGNVATRILALRRAFHESKKNEFHILTEDGVAWRKEATWIRIELTLKAKSKADESTDVTDETRD